MPRSGQDPENGADGRARRAYYLALGDSLSTGVQPIGPEAGQFRTDEGYADQLVELARRYTPGLEVVKLGFPGESTTTMIDGSLGEYVHGSQLREAVAFLREHRGSVAFVTIDIGFNDVPTRDLNGLVLGMSAVSRNLPGILSELRKAAGATTPIVGMTVYDPLLAGWLGGREGRELARLSVFGAVLPMNAHLNQIYRTAGMAVADVEGAFSTTDFETMVSIEGIGAVPLNVARVLAWTWAGTPPPLGPDMHANALGYRAIAEAFEKVLFESVPKGERKPSVAAPHSDRAAPLAIDQ
jgi:lysophospholipase L1-like esterase